MSIRIILECRHGHLVPLKKGLTVNNFVYAQWEKRRTYSYEGFLVFIPGCCCKGSHKRWGHPKEVSQWVFASENEQDQWQYNERMDRQSSHNGRRIQAYLLEGLLPIIHLQDLTQNQKEDTNW